MRLVVSLTRSQSDVDSSLSPVIAVGLSWKEDDKLVHFLARNDDYSSPKEMWEAVARALGRSDVVPYGWNIHNDIWPCICLNLAKHGIDFPKFQPLTEKWSKILLGDISYIATQGAYRGTPKAKDVYQFLFGEEVEALDETYRSLSVGQKELEENSYKEHVAYHRMLEAYK